MENLPLVSQSLEQVQQSRTLEATITRSFSKEKKSELLLNVHHLSSLKCGSRLWSCFIFLPAKWFELLTALKKNHYMVNSTTVHYFVRDAIFFLQQNVSHSDTPTTQRRMERVKWRRAVGRGRKEYFRVGGAWEGEKKRPPFISLPRHDLNGKWLAQIVARIHSPYRLWKLRGEIMLKLESWMAHNVRCQI